MIDPRERLAVTSVERLSVRIPEAAKMLGLGRSKLYQYIKAGKIDVVKAGRATLVPVSSIRDFLEQLRAG